MASDELPAGFQIVEPSAQAAVDDLPPGFTVQTAPGAQIPEPVVPDLTSPESRKRGEIGDRILSLQEGSSFGFSPQVDQLLRDIGVKSNEGPTTAQRLEAMDQTQRLVGNITGGVITGGAIGLAAKGALTTIPRIAALSTVEGAVAGAGFADEGERAKGALVGGATGGTLGIAFPLAASGVSKLIARSSSGLSKADRFAVNRVLRDLRRGGITPEQAAKRVKKLDIKGTLADVPELRDLGRNVVSVPGPGATAAKRTIGGRAAGARDRLQEAIRQTISAEDFGEFRSNLIRGRQETAEELFGEARAFGVIDESPALTRLLGRLEPAKAGANEFVRRGGSSTVRKALKEVKDINPNLAELPDTDMRVLDAVYKRVGEKAFGPGAARSELSNVRDQLKEAIAEQVPVYREALETFSGDKLLGEALDQGRKVLRQDDFLTVDLVKKMSEGEKEAFLIGVARAASDEVSKGTVRANVAARVFSAKSRVKLQAAFPTRSGFRDFRRAMLRELEFAETNNAVLQGSRTAPLQEGQRDLLRDAGRVKRASERLGQRDVVGAAEALATGNGTKPPITDQQSRALGQLLFADGADPTRPGLQSLRQLGQSQRSAPSTLSLPATGGLVPAEAPLLQTRRRPN